MGELVELAVLLLSALETELLNSGLHCSRTKCCRKNNHAADKISCGHICFQDTCCVRDYALHYHATVPGMLSFVILVSLTPCFGERHGFAASRRVTLISAFAFAETKASTVQHMVNCDIATWLLN